MKNLKNRMSRLFRKGKNQSLQMKNPLTLNGGMSGGVKRGFRVYAAFVLAVNFLFNALSTYFS